jgi:hypothetical protein
MRITIKDIINKMNQVAIIDPRINGFGFGPEYDLVGYDIKYPYMYIISDQIHNVNFTDENKYRSIELNFIIRIGDRVNDQINVYDAIAENSNNGLDNISDTFNILIDVINVISENSLNFFEDLSLIDDIEIEPFYHEDKGDVNGHQATITLRIKNDGVCSNPITANFS